MTISNVHHVQITIPVGGEEQARAFYCKVLELGEIVKPASLRERGGFWLRAGRDEVHIGTQDGVDRTATKAHVAFQVTDIESWRRRLEDSAVPITESITIPGYDRFEIRDPFGNRLEFIQPVDS